MLFRLLFLSLLIVTTILTEAQAQSQWTGCIDPDNLDSPDLVKIGERHTICLTVGPGGSWAGTLGSDGKYAGVEYMRYTWRPNADQYSRFHIPNSYNDLIASPQIDLGGKSGNLTVHAASQSSLSFLRVYYDKEMGRVFPFLTIVVDARDGIVQGLAWDDACVFCNQKRCLDNMYNFNGNKSSDLGVKQPSKGCYLTVEECNVITDAGGKDCDITLYVVWTGTDVENRVFSSSPNRFSAFPSSNLKESIVNAFPKLPSIGNPF